MKKNSSEGIYLKKNIWRSNSKLYQITERMTKRSKSSISITNKKR